MTKKKKHKREELKKMRSDAYEQNIDSDSERDNEYIRNTKHLYETAYKMLQIEEEIKDLYEERFNIKLDSEFGLGYSIFTEDEQIERYAQHVAFWQTLYEEYEGGMMAPIRNLRWQYILRKNDCFRMSVYEKFHHKPELITTINKRAIEILRIT